MADRNVARRYAQAFIDLAQESDSLDKLGTELTSILTAVQTDDGKLFAALSNPVFKKDERQAVLDQLLKTASPDPLTTNLLSLLIERNRFALLPTITDLYGEMADTLGGRVRVLVQTAEPLQGAMEAEVRATLEQVTGKQVILETEIVPALIGGMIARVGSKVYDASIRTRLEQLKLNLITTQTPAEA